MWKFPRIKQEISAPPAPEITQALREKTSETVPDGRAINVNPRDIEREQTHELLESLAREAEIGALAQRNNLLIEAELEHAEDVANFKFKCARWEDWLEVSLARPRASLSTAIFLSSIKSMQLIEGYVPDLNGKLTYDFIVRGKDGERRYCEYGNVALPEDRHYEVFPVLPAAPEKRALRYFPAEPDVDFRRGYPFYENGPLYDIKHDTPNFVRFAQDDLIRFEGSDICLSVPATTGADVYKKLLATKNKLVRRGK